MTSPPPEAQHCVDPELADRHGREGEGGAGVWLEDDPGHEDYVKYDGTGECGEILMATLKLLQIFDHSEQKHG